MRETVTLTGMVLLSAPSGDFDRRLVLLTRERGKITAFSHGARKPGNPLMAASRPFCFGNFNLYEGRNAYNLQSAQITNYFDGLSTDMEAACYGSYFLETAAYFAQENLDGTELLKLLYQSLRALLRPAQRIKRKSDNRFRDGFLVCCSLFITCCHFVYGCKSRRGMLQEYY